MSGRGARRDLGCRWLATLALVCLSLSPATATAQQAFSLGTWSARFEAGADWTRESSDSLRTQSKLRRRRYNQRFTLRNSGLVLGRRLLVVRGGMVLGLRQDRTVTSGLAAPTAGRVLDYEVSGDLLSTKPYSVAFGASRSDSLFTPKLGATTITQRSSANVTMRLRNLPLAPTLSMQRFHVDQQTSSGDRAIHTVETRETYSFTGAQRSGWQSLSMAWKYNDRRNDLVPGSGLQTHSASLEQNIRLPWLDTDGLQGSLQFFRREGTARTTRLNIVENLTLRIFPSLTSTLGYRFSERHERGRVFVSTTMSGSLSHSLYQSLATSLSASSTANRQPSGRASRVSLGYGLTYRKRIIGGGKLGIRYSGGKQHENNAVADNELDVLQERHEGRLGVPFTLAEPHVVPGSIVVSDETGSLVFQPGVDYLVEFIGNIVEISTTPEGRIDDGQILLIDYRVLTAPFTRSVDTRRVFGFSVDYGPIAVSYRTSSIGHDLLEGDDGGLFAPASNRAYGLRTRFNGARYRVVASADYTIEDSSAIVASRMSLNQFFGYQFGSGATLSVNLSESFQNSQNPSRKARNGLARITMRWSLGPILELDALVTARLRDDSDGRSEAYYEAGFGVQWAYGAFRFTSDLRHFWTHRDDLDRTGLRASARVSRRF